MITPENLVSREVVHCCSTLASTLASGYGADMPRDLAEMAEAAFELSTPIDDWEEAAIQAGWHKEADGSWFRAALCDDEAPRVTARDAQDACGNDMVEPIQREIFEHWIVSDWLAENLEQQGEKVDTDFFGLTVWARTTTGQGIASDSVIVAICDAINAESAA